jgi:hypothetical protein
MSSYVARIERANGRLLDQVEVSVNVTEASSGRQRWSGEFVSRSADGFQPNERFSLTLSTGQKGTANVSRTLLDSRSPDTTVIEFMGSGALS